MFEDLFTKRSTIESYRAAPLVEPRERYLRHLAASGARRLTLRQIALDQVRLLHVLDLREGEKIDVARIRATAPGWFHTRIHRLGIRPPTTKKSAKRSLSRVIRWLRFLGWLHETGEDPHPYGVELGAFEEWMRAERGHAEGTIAGRLRCARELLDRLIAGGKRLESARFADIDAAIEAKKPRSDGNRVTIRRHAECLRTFIRFAEDRGWCAPGMAEGIVPVRFYPGESVRSALSRADIRRLLATADGGRASDKRDRAILLLLIVYGLRAGEVRTLRLDDLDWKNETLRVHRPKTGRTDLYPLSHAVGRAIVRYIVEVRPRRPERALFLTLSAPIGPLSRSAPGIMVRRRMDEAGIAAARRGTHALRHTAAQHLLDRGVSMKVIGDYLGHRSPRSTKTYARFDLNALREVADFDLEGLA